MIYIRAISADVGEVKRVWFCYFLYKIKGDAVFGESFKDKSKAVVGQGKSPGGRFYDMIGLNEATFITIILAQVSVRTDAKKARNGQRAMNNSRALLQGVYLDLEVNIWFKDWANERGHGDKLQIKKPRRKQGSVKISRCV